MPETYLIPLDDNFENSLQFQTFKSVFKEKELWIFKPGEATNRGHFIDVFNSLAAIIKNIKEFLSSNEEGSRQNGGGPRRYRSVILQRYIANPLLVHKRKFDIRVFALVVCHAETQKLRAYFFDEGYLRTSSKEYCPEKFSNRLIHLTNDAIQKNSADYGKFESANKISYQDFDKLLEKDHQASFFGQILPKIRQ